MGRITEISAENISLTAGITGFCLLSSAAAGAAAANIRVKRVEISQRGTTTAQMLGVAFSTQTGTTVTATSLAPKALSPLGGPASGLAGNTAPAGAAGRSGSNLSVNTTPGYTDHHYGDFHNLSGYLWKSDPKEEIWIPASTLWVLRLVADPTTLTGWTYAVILEED